MKLSIMETMSPSEAIYGFLGWLTTRPEVTKFGGACDCAPAAQLADKWCKENDLDEPTDVFPDNIKHPKSEPGSKIKGEEK
jgi:hypothetical protein